MPSSFRGDDQNMKSLVANGSQVMANSHMALLGQASWSIVQSYYGENKLIFWWDDDMPVFVLDQHPVCP